jgi:hypothetical protein
MDRGFFEYEDTLISRDLIEKKFVCDLEKCKGACCTMESEYGAPLDAEEIDLIDSILTDVLDYLPEQNRDLINREGFWEKKTEQLMTKTVENRECVFVYYDENIARCAIERAYLDSKVEFRKPISCHLFPIRKNDFGGRVLRFEEYSECDPALIKGIKENVTTLDFCRDSLERLFDKKWFNGLKNFIGS